MTNPNANQPPLTAAQLAESQKAADQATAHRAPDDAEEVYYEGSPLLRGSLGKGALWLLGSLAMIALAVAAGIYHNSWHFHWWAYPILLVIALVLFLVPVIQSKTVRYRVTNYRIDYERGLLGKDIATLELWHVEDVSFHQSFVDRLLGVGNITVLSHDDTMPTLVMHDVPQSRELFEQLKQRIIAVKRSRGVIKMDPG